MVETDVKMKEEVALPRPEDAEEFKNKGNEEFKKGNYLEAINYYNQALGTESINTNNFI